MKKGMFTYVMNYCPVSNVWGVFETKDSKREFPLYSHKDKEVIKELYMSLAYGIELPMEAIVKYEGI